MPQIVTSIASFVLGGIAVFNYLNPSEIKANLVQKDTLIQSCQANLNEQKQLINGMLMNK
jgi:hypothetical protein